VVLTRPYLQEGYRFFRRAARAQTPRSQSQFSSAILISTAVVDKRGNVWRGGSKSDRSRPHFGIG
jgi:hypothetical protein